jgi:transcription elongation GreA/GreB family factor
LAILGAVGAKLDKRRILDTLLASLEAEATALLAAANATIAGATHEEARPENDKDTRALEATYLARGQARRVEETHEIITRLRFVELRDFDDDDPIGPTALVAVEIDGDRTEQLFVLTHGGGRTVEIDGVTLRIVTTASPVGRALLGKQAGDDFTLQIAGKRREYVIESVR